jgi:hypothetical protein
VANAADIGSVFIKSLFISSTCYKPLPGAALHRNISGSNLDVQGTPPDWTLSLELVQKLAIQSRHISQATRHSINRNWQYSLGTSPKPRTHSINRNLQYSLGTSPKPRATLLTETGNTVSAHLPSQLTHLGPVNNFFFFLDIFFRQLRVCYFVAPSLTRGRVCNLLLLLVLASAVPLGSESRGTQDHILLSQFLRLPQPGGPGPRIYIPQKQGGPVTPGHWVPFPSAFMRCCFFFFFFHKDPIYLQSVIIHSANGGKG